MAVPEKKDGSCAHPPCACTGGTYERNGKRYCSVACANQADDAREAAPCPCGHAPCLR